MRTHLAIAALACWLVAGTAAADTVAGGVYVWQIPPGATSVRFNDRPVFTLRDRAIVGIPISAEPGSAQISYVAAGQPQTHGFTIRPKQYTEQHITIKDQTKVDPPQRDLARIREEAQRQRALYDSATPGVQFERQFILPLEGITTSQFGHRRFFNGQPRSPHSGLDIAADQGTPVVAPAGGTVRLADDLFFNGKTIFLDHGQGLVTMYCHLSEHKVAVDDRVSQGDVIGLVGATGRATGPHLHWSVSLNGYRVDPHGFMQALAGVLSASSGAE